MNRKPNPAAFNNFDAFCDAMVSHAVSICEKVSDFDNFSIARAKNKRIEQARQSAREDAFDIWESFVDYRTDQYERGVGPAWDDF